MRNVYRALFAAMLAALFLPGISHGQDSVSAWRSDTSAPPANGFTPRPQETWRTDSTTRYPTTSAESDWDPFASSATETTYVQVAQRERTSRTGPILWVGSPSPSEPPANRYPPESYGFTARRPTRGDVGPAGWGPTAIDSTGYLGEERIDTSSTLLSWPDAPCGDISFSSRFHRGMRRSWTDHRYYYTCDTLYPLLLSLGAGGVVANTSLDQGFRDWYQDDVSCRALGRFSDFWRPFGDGYLALPFFAGLSAAAMLYDDGPCGSVVAEFSGRTVRGFLVGAPPMLAMQYMLGASRPHETSHESQWRPFYDTNAVSGHSFIGAVPFLTAARMTDDYRMKTALYLCSAMPAWSRVQDDRHYLSQVCLGWWMAYLACASVDKTELAFGRLTVSPIASTEMVGFGMVYKR